MRKPAYCIQENKSTDQLPSNLCFRYIDHANIYIYIMRNDEILTDSETRRTRNNDQQIFFRPGPGTRPRERPRERPEQRQRPEPRTNPPVLDKDIKDIKILKY